MNRNLVFDYENEDFRFDNEASLEIDCMDIDNEYREELKETIRDLYNDLVIELKDMMSSNEEIDVCELDSSTIVCLAKSTNSNIENHIRNLIENFEEKSSDLYEEFLEEYEYATV